MGSVVLACDFDASSAGGEGIGSVTRGRCIEAFGVSSCDGPGCCYGGGAAEDGDFVVWAVAVGGFTGLGGGGVIPGGKLSSEFGDPEGRAERSGGRASEAVYCSSGHCRRRVRHFEDCENVKYEQSTSMLLPFDIRLLILRVIAVEEPLKRGVK